MCFIELSFLLFLSPEFLVLSLESVVEEMYISYLGIDEKCQAHCTMSKKYISLM